MRRGGNPASWRHGKPPVQRLLLTPRDQADEIHMLTRLVRNLNETVQSLWDTVDDLRLELGAVRPMALLADHADPRPPTWRLPPANADLAEQVETLRRQVDELNGDAEYLWFETQWLRAQLAVFRGDVGPPGGSP
jgi:hypothetical protein